MLTVTLPSAELFDNEKWIFITLPEVVITIEHSLLSVSKWEAKWRKPYISRSPKTREESIDYIRCMIVGKSISSERLSYIPDNIFHVIQDYIDDPMTATWFRNDNRPMSSGQAITSELIYSWMVAAQIPFDPAEKWHLNRLLVLIRICSENANPKKMSKKEVLNQQRALNSARRAKRRK